MNSLGIASRPSKCVSKSALLYVLEASNNGLATFSPFMVTFSLRDEMPIISAVKEHYKKCQASPLYRATSSELLRNGNPISSWRCDVRLGTVSAQWRRKVLIHISFIGKVLT